MNQEELNPQEDPQEGITPTAEVQTEEEQHEEVVAVIAEDDHDQPKEKKLGIPDFDSMSVEECLDVISSHLKEFAPERLKGIVESGRSRVLHVLNGERDAAKTAYLEEGGNIIDFQYDQPTRKQLNVLYGEYRDRLRKHYAQLEAELSSNLATKLEIIEQIKALPNAKGSAKEKYDTFKGLREKWNNTGLVPKGDSRNVWANFHHHVDNFFNYLRMAYDLIEIDYQNNLSEKEALCAELEEDVKGGASPELFRKLQQAHSRWKRIGPVPRERKDELWERFKAVTSNIHTLRDSFNEQIKELDDKKIEQKRAIVEKIEALCGETYTKHNHWQKASKELEALRASFKKIGFVKSEENAEVWESYKEAQREFNRLKNNFYKDEKKAHRDNLEQKQALVDLVTGLKDSEDFEETARALKKAQADWKKTGYVPKKEGDQLWEAFRGACNHFFDRMNGQKKEQEKKSTAALKAKKDFIATAKKAKVGTLEDAILLSENWAGLGHGGRNSGIEEEFETVLSDHLSKLGLSTQEMERALFEAKVKALVEADDQDGLHRQRNWVREQLDRTKKELHQLENNLAFFSNSKGNPLLEAAQEKIESQKSTVEHYTGLRKLFNSLLK